MVSRPLLFLLFLSAMLHLWDLSEPDSVVFDEVHFGKFVTAYCCSGERFFDIHPPHGKLLIAGVAKLGGYQGDFGFDSIGQPYGHTPIFSLRLVPAISGILLPLILYGLLIRLGASRAAAWFGALLITLDNGLLVQSRIIALDAILLVGIFGALYAFLTAEDAGPSRQRRLWLILAGMLCGLALGTKFTGLTAIGLILLIGLLRCWERPTLGRLMEQLRRLPWVLSAAILIYLPGWALHFALLPHPGPGDAFYPPSGEFLTDLVRLHQVMFQANYGLASPHADSSPWWSWPLMLTPILYWAKEAGLIYFIGNPLLWWGASLLLLVFGVNLGLQRVSELRLWPEDRPPRSLWIPLAGFTISLVPHILIPRVLFLYHYLPPLLFSLLFVVLCLDRVGWIRPGGLQAQRRSYFVALALVFMAFLLTAPLTYGAAFLPGYLELLFRVFPGWR